MIDKQRLSADAAAFGMVADDEQISLLAGYCGKLIETNRFLNLTAITEPREIEIKHLLDSILCSSLPELSGEVADVGTGGGFPGVVLKVMRPELNLTLIDSTGKKLRFIEGACCELGIGLKTIHGRAEELARGSSRDSFVARAVAQLSSLCELCLPLVKVGGYFVAMKGPEIQDELERAANAIKLLGGKTERTEIFELPDGGGTRTIIIIKKISQTPTRYPRGGKNITNSPL